MTTKLPSDILARAESVGFTVGMQADGAYWIPSIGKWRSAEEVEEMVLGRERNNRRLSPAERVYPGIGDNA